MNLRDSELASHLARELRPLYVVHGDEPLLVLEAGDAIRAAARNGGVTEREVFVVEPAFRWDAFEAAHANLGLFGDRKLVDLRIPTGKPGSEGGKLLERYAANPNPDNVTLVTLPRLDKAAQGSAWFSALSEAGVIVSAQTPDREALPRWIAARLARQKQQATSETLAFLADHCEGNLLAARQEIEKLALLFPAGMLDADAVEAAVADVARYDVFAASEAWLAGDAARVVRILSVIEAEGDGPQLAIWTLGEDLHAIAAVQAMTRSGTPSTIAIRNARVWGKRQIAMERALARVTPAEVERMLADVARIDALAKGIGCGNAWDALVAVGLTLAGSPAHALAATTP
ncbi:MAG TPA: DNA polymerase III subunit delta [Casimicrobiaceae bacterium]|nr:DNA polymerase III subunit delta [Casimicrobiaceae bacterium]